ncbi:MAG: recombinase family protein [Candidatus Puniceispirillaceae bacterium]
MQEQLPPARQPAPASLHPPACNGTHSTVAKGRCRWVFSPTDLTFNFTLTCRSPALHGNYYSDYQLFLYQTISEHREKGMTFNAIAEWLNKEGYLTVRGRTFRGAHVHSILKKRLAKEKFLNRDYPPVWSDFSIEVVDKTILMNDFGVPNRKK